MLVANLLFFLRRIVLEGFSRTQNNLEILADDFKLGRWQKDLLGCCDHLVNPAASFFADVDSSHQGGQIFVSASRRTVDETLSIDQRTAGSVQAMFRRRMVAQRLHYHNDQHGDLDDRRYGLVEGDRHVLIV